MTSWKERLRSHRAPLLGALALLLLATGGVIAWQSRPDPQVEKVRGLGSAIMRGIEKMPWDKKIAAITEAWEEAKDLTPQQREQIFIELMQEKTREERAELEQFFRLPRGEQAAKIDGDIRRSEEQRKQWEAMKKGLGALAGFFQKKQDGDKGGTTGGGQGKGDQRDFFGNKSWKSMTDAERDDKMRQFLDRMDPVYMGLKSEYRRLVDNRRKELGLPAGKGGGFPR